MAEVQAGGTLSVNAFEFWHARGPTGLARLAKDLICAPASQAYVQGKHIFCLWAALFWTTKTSLSKTQSESAERNLLSTVTVFHRLDVNVTDLCRKSLAEHN